MWQIVASEKSHAKAQTFKVVHDALRAGDIAMFTGHPGKTKTGELSLFATNVRSLLMWLEATPHPWYTSVSWVLFDSCCHCHRQCSCSRSVCPTQTIRQHCLVLASTIYLRSSTTWYALQTYPYLWDLSRTTGTTDTQSTTGHVSEW